MEEEMNPTQEVAPETVETTETETTDMAETPVEAAPQQETPVEDTGAEDQPTGGASATSGPAEARVDESEGSGA